MQRQYKVSGEAVRRNFYTAAFAQHLRTEQEMFTSPVVFGNIVIS